jgi:hypothetical protein
MKSIYLIAPDGNGSSALVANDFSPPDGWGIGTAPAATPVQPSPRESLRLAWIAQPVAIRAAFAATYAAVNLALDQGDNELAVYLVGAAAVPPELEAAKVGLLQLVEAVP